MAPDSPAATQTTTSRSHADPRPAAPPAVPTSRRPRSSAAPSRARGSRGACATSDRHFERGEDEGTFRATERGDGAAHAARSGSGAASGASPSAHRSRPRTLEEQRLPKWKALAVFSSDALSSSAYATDEILLVLAAAGAGALTHSIAIAAGDRPPAGDRHVLVPADDQAYPSGGGAYIVARENLGDVAGLTRRRGARRRLRPHGRRCRSRPACSRSRRRSRSCIRLSSRDLRRRGRRRSRC